MKGKSSRDFSRFLVRRRWPPKNQAPSAKIQRRSSFQAQKSLPSDTLLLFWIWGLGVFRDWGFGVWSFSGTWSLRFGTFLLLRHWRDLFGGVQNIIRGNNNHRHILRLPTEQAQAAAASAFERAQDENSQGLALESECGRAQGGRGHRGVRDVKPARSLDNGRNACHRSRVGAPGRVAETVQRDHLVENFRFAGVGQVQRR